MIMHSKDIIYKLVAITVMFLLGGSSFAQNDEKNIARVQKINGIYAFCDNEPICDYEILDRVKSGVSWTDQFKEIRNKLIKKALRDFPDADGVVITMANVGFDRAIVIKFKEGQEKDKLALARVNRVNGLLVFTDCEPVNEYNIAERTKAAFGWSAQYQPVRDKLIKKAVKTVPDADGVVLSFSTGGVDRAIIIKFK